MSRRRKYGIASLLAIVVLVVIALPAIRHSILRAAGRVLVVSDPVGSADVIVISGEAEEVGELEASDLVHRGVANTVAVFAYPPDAVQSEFLQRGVAYENTAARSVRLLRALGVKNVVEIPGNVKGTEHEGTVLTRWCDEQRFRSVVVVGLPDHSRRLQRVLHRSLKGHRTTLIVCSARYALFDPDRWWESRDGTRIEIEELQKLLLDIMRHPLS